MLTENDLKKLSSTLINEKERELEQNEQDYLIEELDYSYIGKCANLKELRKLERILKSGKEGEYPKLLEFLQDRISKISNENVEAFTENAQKEFMADKEKEKGNECFKAQEYNDAIIYYTKSLQIMKRAHVFTNRANAYLKIGQYEKAENDSSAALELNDNVFIFKAYVRRAEARRKRGKLWEALKDLDQALKIDPDSSLACNLRNQIEIEYKKVEGDLAKDTRGPKSRLEIQEVSSSTVTLEPSSITEVSDEEADALQNSKDVKVEMQDFQELMQGLKNLSPSLDLVSDEEKHVENTLMLQVQDVEQDDEDIDIFKREIESSKINVIDEEKIDDDCEAFQKELELMKSNVSESNISNVTIKDTAEIDDDCEAFQKELELMRAEISEGNVSSVKDTADEIQTKDAGEHRLFAAPQSSIEFEATWNSIKGDIKKFSSYLSCIDDRNIIEFLAMVNNADLHIDLILSTEYMKDSDRIFKLVEFVTTLPRFNVVRSFMTWKQKAHLAATLSRLETEAGDKRIQVLFDTFKLR